MTGDGMCGVFIPDRVLAGWWRSQWKASVRMWAGRCTTGSFPERKRRHPPSTL